MPDTLTTITNLINSPPGQLVAGGVLAGIVWKFFERVESVLNEDTKLEIAVWLLGVRVEQKMEPWPSTFIKVFARVFGEKAFSLRCFLSSCLATFTACLMCTIGLARYFHLLQPLNEQSVAIIARTAGTTGIVLFAFDYLSLLETRYTLKLMRRWSSAWGLLLLLIVDTVATGLTGAVPSYYRNVGLTLHPLRQYAFRVAKEQAPIELLQRDLEARALRDSDYLRQLDDIVVPDYDLASRDEGLRKELEDIRKRREELRKQVEEEQHQSREMARKLNTLREVRSAWNRFDVLVLWIPAFFTSIWLWLYAGSGFLLKASRRFDIGFQWFNRKFDIEKKPLQSIGLVAGALVR